MIIDFHNHYFPLSYIENLRERIEFPKVILDSAGRQQLYQRERMMIPITDATFDLKKRLSEMDRLGVDMQVLSITIPGVERVEPELGIKLARGVNDEYSMIVSKHEKRFCAFAALPLQDPESSLEEMDRALFSLALNGIEVFSNVSGKPLDSPALEPVFKRAEEKRVPIFLHPTIPAALGCMEDFDLVEAIGFPTDTTLALTRLILSGVLEKFPELKIVAGHLGGSFPYLVGRLDEQYCMTPEARVNVSKPPSKYLKRLYFDTTTSLPESVSFGYELLGPGKMVMGSDYPLWPQKHAIKTVETAKVPRSEKSAIFSETAKKLLINKKWKRVS